MPLAAVIRLSTSRSVRCSRGRTSALGRRDLGPALQLLRPESKRLKLAAPFGRRITESLDADAPGQATFNRCFDEIGCEEGERDRHIHLPNAAFLALRPWSRDLRQHHPAIDGL
jgi:hypothetical protein